MILICEVFVHSLVGFLFQSVTRWGYKRTTSSEVSLTDISSLSNGCSSGPLLCVAKVSLISGAIETLRSCSLIEVSLLKRSELFLTVMSIKTRGLGVGLDLSQMLTVELFHFNPI